MTEKRTDMQTEELTQKARALGRVVVLMGGFSSEREVSLSSGGGVLEALRKAGADAVGFDPKEKDIAELASGKFDRAFISLHGRFGEDGAIQGALEYLQLPYTGPGVRASAVAINKSVTRVIWQAAGLPVAKGMTVTAADEAQAVYDALGGSVVVKPAQEGSSVGVTKLKDAGVEQIRQALADALRFDPCVLVEERIFGRELTVAILDGKALPVIEIQAPEGNYDYRNKYFGNAVHYECPAKLSDELTGQIRATCEKAFAVLGARGWGRIDVMLSEKGAPVLLELNTSPGMTPHSLVPMAARAIGMSYEELCVHVAAGASLDSRH